jgi:2,5-diamino-6-(ribosylamino)-4(3H)-pyrimidinone 5'-phosphate reductase
MKPYVICHLMPSLDGRLDVERWDIGATAHKEYDRTADTYRADGWLCGRVTMRSLRAAAGAHR